MKKGSLSAVGREGGYPGNIYCDSVTEPCSESSSWFLGVDLGFSLGIYMP